MHSHLIPTIARAIGNSRSGNQKWKMEVENGNGQILMDMYTMVNKTFEL